MLEQLPRPASPSTSKNISTSKFQNKMTHVPDTPRAPVAGCERTGAAPPAPWGGSPRSDPAAVPGRTDPGPPPEESAQRSTRLDRNPWAFPSAHAHPKLHPALLPPRPHGQSSALRLPQGQGRSPSAPVPIRPKSLHRGHTEGVEHCPACGGLSHVPTGTEGQAGPVTGFVSEGAGSRERGHTMAGDDCGACGRHHLPSPGP